MALVRQRDLTGLGHVPRHNPKNNAQEKTSTRNRFDVPNVLRLGARNLLRLSVTSLRLVRRLARAAVQRDSRIIPPIYIHRLLALFAVLLYRFRLESLPVCPQIAVAAILAGKEGPATSAGANGGSTYERRLQRHRGIVHVTKWRWDPGFIRRCHGTGQFKNRISSGISSHKETTLRTAVFACSSLSANGALLGPWLSHLPPCPPTCTSLQNPFQRQ